MLESIFASHNEWIKRGYSFDDIQKIRNEIMDNNPFTGIRYSDVNSSLNIFELGTCNPLKINYLFLDQFNFSGDLNLLKPLINLEYLIIDGNNIDKKVENIEVLRGFKYLKVIELPNNEIKNIEALSTLKDLEILNLKYNQIEDFTALKQLNKLKTLEVFNLDKKVLFEVLKSNVDVVINNCIESERMSNFAFNHPYASVIMMHLGAEDEGFTYNLMEFECPIKELPEKLFYKNENIFKYVFCDGFFEFSDHVMFDNFVEVKLKKRLIDSK